MLISALVGGPQAAGVVAQDVASAPAGGASTVQDKSGETWFLADRIYYEPLLAEQRSARTFLLVPGWSSQFPHSIEAGTRFAWQVSLGREIPILGWQNDSTIGLDRFPKGRWGFGLWVPVAFHMVEDFADESNPIVDTDYRFGLMAKAQYGLSARSTISIRFVPWAHESTHLGDEYVLFAARAPAFERINVSYEYMEYGLSFERSFTGRGLVTVRHGGILLHGEDGYYSDHLLGSDAATLTPSQKNYEPSLGVELRVPRGGRTGRQWLASVDFRHRLQYHFHRPPGVDERRRPTWTVAIGRAVPEGERTFLRSYFVYATHGVNPYGQLREQYPFRAIGLGWVFQ